MLTVIKAEITTLQVDAIVNAKLTKGYLIPAKYVIHTVALVCYGDKSGESDFLASYRRSLSFPSTGVYGYPVDQAAKIAVVYEILVLGEKSSGKDSSYHGAYM